MNSLWGEFELLKHPEKVKELLDKGDSAPIMAEIDPTNGCNFNCSWCCDKKFKQKNQHLPKERAFSLINELCERNLKSIVIKGGGEPTLSPYLLEYLHFIHDKGLDIGIITNGSNISSELARIICATTTWIKVSLDAATGETHTQMHGLRDSTFDSVIENIKLIIQMKESTNSNIAIGINFTINEGNYKEIMMATNLAKKLGADYILLKFMVFEKRNVSSERFQPLERTARNLIAKSQELNSDSFSVFFQDRNDGEKGWEKCLFNPFITTTCASGDVYPCCHTKGHEEFCYGNFMNKSFWEVWDGVRRKQIYEKVKNKECLKYCSFRYTAHNRILNYLAKDQQPHCNFI